MILRMDSTPFWFAVASLVGLPWSKGCTPVLHFFACWAFVSWAVTFFCQTCLMPTVVHKFHWKQQKPWCMRTSTIDGMWSRPNCLGHQFVPKMCWSSIRGTTLYGVNHMYTMLFIPTTSSIPIFERWTMFWDSETSSPQWTGKRRFRIRSTRAKFLHQRTFITFVFGEMYVWHISWISYSVQHTYNTVW